MSERYKFRDPNGVYFITSTTAGWVDVFTRPELKHVVIDSLRHCQSEKGLAIHAWCLMTSHLHMICSSSGDDLSRIMMTFKSHTSKEIVKVLDTVFESRRDWILKHFSEAGEDLRRITNFKVWKDGNHPIWQ